MRTVAVRRVSRVMAYIALAAAWILVFVLSARGGGPQYVAGVEVFDPASKGKPLIWPQGMIDYYTDQGPLSPVLTGPAADALVADAFSRWSNIPTVALLATQAGHLAEDVDGSNVTAVNGVLTLPADIQPTALATPVGIVYDFDGQVTETLLGTGSSADCMNNAAFGGLDNFSTNGSLAHAVVILNGTCVTSASQVVDFEYRLVRVLGRVLGLAPSQANLNVWTGIPVPGTPDWAGFPVMHAIDLASCLPVTNCLTTPDQPKMDDRAALGRLYPVTSANQTIFLGKTIFADTTARIHGTVSFPASDVSGQGMQGVNVVARWIDPATLQPSRTFVASTVSGFLYRGNNGNPITGFADASGQPWDRWGSDDPTVQGFFDLAGLEIPNGDLAASYQLTFERVDPLLSEVVGPYEPLQVEPSGESPAVVVPVFQGGDVTQDIVMGGAATPTASPASSQDYLNPLPVPTGGQWESWLNTAGGTNYYAIHAQANRTLSIEVATVDEQGNPSQEKAQPVIGIWALADPAGTPPPSSTPDSFNTGILGLSRLDAQVLTETDFRIGISDFRGDGRPDYGHHVRVLYADSLSPPRVSAAGGDTLQVAGLGFQPAMAAQVGGMATPVVDFGATQMLLQMPAVPDGLQTVVVSDPATGGFSTMTNAVTVGAGPSDTVQLLPVANPAIPVGGETLTPLPFLVSATDGTPVVGATVALSATNGMTLDPCGGSSACSVFSDQSGHVIVNVGFTQVGTGQVVAQLAPASYAAPSTAVATLTGVSSNLDIALLGQSVEVEQGTTIDVPLQARVLNVNGPQPGVAVNFVALGPGSLRFASIVTDSGGNALNVLHLAPVQQGVQVSACVAPANNPCKTFAVTAVPVAALQMEAVSGIQQIVTQGQAVDPVVVRVTDNSLPPFPVFGANVTFVNVLSRSGVNGTTATVDDVVTTPNFDPVLLGSQTTVVQSDIDGLASIAPWPGPLSAGEQVSGLASADSGSQVTFSLQVLAAPDIGGARVGLPGGRRGPGRISVRVPVPARSPFLGSAGIFANVFPMVVWNDAGTDFSADFSGAVVGMPPEEDPTPPKTSPEECPSAARAPDETVPTPTCKTPVPEVSPAPAIVP